MNATWKLFIAVFLFRVGASALDCSALERPHGFHCQDECFEQVGMDQFYGVCAKDFYGHCRRPDGIHDFIAHWGDCLLGTCRGDGERRTFVEVLHASCLDVHVTLSTLPGEFAQYVPTEYLPTTVSATKTVATSFSMTTSAVLTSHWSRSSSVPVSASETLNSIAPPSSSSSAQSSSIPASVSKSLLNSSSSSPVSEDSSNAFGTTQMIGTAAGASIGIALAAAAGIFLVRRRGRNLPESVPFVPREADHGKEGKAELSGQTIMPTRYTPLVGVSELDSGTEHRTYWNGSHGLSQRF